jgi:hypothetical protein
VTPPDENDAEFDRLAVFIQDLADFRAYGSVKVRTNDQIVLPKEARDELRLEGAAHYNLYGSPRLGIALLIGEPQPADDFVSRARAIKR